MKLFDSHCHLEDSAFEKDLEAVLERALEAGVEGIMVVGDTGPSSARAVSIARAHKGCHASVGVHPHDAKTCDPDLLEELTELARDPLVRAWGEIGLDYNRMHSPAQVQESWFVRQLDVAARLALPVILHERDSGGRLLDLLRAHGGRMAGAVIHCFSGSGPELSAYLRLGCHIGLTGIVTQKQRGRALRELMPVIPRERILIETDAPYLTPSPERNRHRRNEPAFLPSVLLGVAAALGEDPGPLSEVIWENTCRFYGIGV